MDLPLDQKQLEAFVAGTLAEAEVEQVLRLLEENEAALQYVDKLWSEQLAGEELAPPEEISIERQRLLERRFFGSLQRSELGGRAIRFGTAGFLSVVWAFLRPILTPRQKRRQTGDSNG